MRNKIWLISLLLLIFSLAGCWDLEEIDRRLFITLLGVDINPNGQLEISVQIPLPQAMRPSDHALDSLDDKIFNTLSVTANTVFEGFGMLQAKTSRRLVIQENKIIIIGKALAQLGIEPVLNWLARSPYASPQEWLYISDQYTAKELLSFEPVVKRQPGQELTITSQAASKYDRIYFIPLWLFRERLLDKARDPYAALITYSQEEQQYVREGLAVFDEDRMVGELTPDEAQMFGLITSQMKAGYMTFLLPPERYGQGHRVSLRNVSGKTKIKVLLKEGEPIT